MQDTSLDHVILSYALHSKLFATEVSNSTTYSYFNTDIQWLYKAIMDHFYNPKFRELPTAAIINEHLVKNYSNPEFIKSGNALFAKVMAVENTPAEFKWYLEKLKTRYNSQVHKITASSLTKLIKEGGDETENVEKLNDVMKSALATIDSIHQVKTYREGSLDESAKARMQQYKEVEANPEVAQGIMSGFGELDRITNGLHGGEVLMIGGPTGGGKSIVMHNMAVNAYLGKQNPMENPPLPEQCVKGHNILFFTLEMSKDKLERRIDACISQVKNNEIRDGKLSPADREKYFKGLRFQARYSKKFEIIDMPRGATVRDMELKYLERAENEDTKYDLVVADYIGIMKSINPVGSDWLDLGKIAEELHEFARMYKVPVITACQVNKGSGNPNEQHYSTDRFARSNMIPQNIDIGLQIGSRGDDEYMRLDMPVAIVKMRDGERGSFTLAKEFDKMRVVDIVDATFANGAEEDDIV